MNREYDYYIPPSVTINDDGSVSDMSDVYEFDDRDQFFLKSFTGWGMPEINYITQQGPFQNGVTALDYRLKPRIIQYVHRRLGNCRQDYWTHRSDIINKLRPNFQLASTFDTAVLRKILPDGSIRDLDVLIDRGPNFNPRNVSEWDEYAFEETVRFIAFDPIIYDPVLQSATWELEDLENLIFYDAANWPNRAVFDGDTASSRGVWFTGDRISDTLSITYDGTWLSYPTITITGPLQSSEITNNTTGEKIELEYNISSGEIVTINLAYGQKTVVNNSGTNLIGTVTTDSDVATFHIAPDPEAPGGVNSLTVDGNGSVINETSVVIEWYTRYIGI